MSEQSHRRRGNSKLVVRNGRVVRQSDGLPMGSAPRSATFTLRCVGCKRTEKRPADKCIEQPFCSECYMPMILETVDAKT